MPTQIEKVGQRLYFRNSPFAGKDTLKAGGAKWDPDARCWWIGATKVEEAKALAAKADEAASTAPTTPKPFVHYSCKQCGKRPGPRGWPRIYKNGICSDCYQDAREDY